MIFRSENGDSVATVSNTGLFVEGLDIPHTITLTPIEQIAQVTIPKPIPEVFEKKPKIPEKKDPHHNVLEPLRHEVHDTGYISGPGAGYNDEGIKVREADLIPDLYKGPIKYRYRIERILRKGKNIIIKLEDGSTLTLRWRSHIWFPTGKGWTVKTEKEYVPLYMKSDRYV